MKTITLDSSQQEFVNRVGRRCENVGCLTVAGGGKTTTVVEAVHRLRRELRHCDILTVAFNRHNRDQLEAKLRDESHIRTADSLCYVAVYKWLKGNKKEGNPFMPSMDAWGALRDENKAEKLVQAFGMEYWGLDNRAFTQEQWQVIEDVQAIATMGMNTLTHPYDWAAIERMCFTYGLFVPQDEDFVEQAIQYVFEKGLSREMLTQAWTYSELRYVAATNPDVRLWQYPVVLVDEAQDLCRAHQVVLSKSLRDKLHFLGDIDQQIYVFSGADADAWNSLRARPNTSIVDSPITYRCPKQVVALAQSYVPRIQAAPNAIEGDVFCIKETDLLANLQAGDVYLSKTNLGAISVALRCLEAGKPAFVKGRSIGADMKGLLTTLEKDKSYRFDNTVSAVRQWERQQVAILCAKYGENVSPEQVAYLHDRAASLERLYYGALQQGVSDPYLFRQYIDSLFEENPRREDVVLTSTVHKFKGFENPAVFLNEADLRPRACRSEPLTQADRNATYVAITRALETLFIVEEDPLSRTA